jgi:Kef-type K+ transport system membrane component KefB/nucleotide-binding universal stress UspA family protein
MAAILHSPLALFVVQAILVITCARVVGLLAYRIRQPMVIAEVVAGILLGPSLLGTVSPRALAILFPKESMPYLSMMSQVGLILFMFLIGLELDPKLLRGRGHTSVVISHTSIVVPCLLGALLGLYLYPRLAPPGVSFSSFVLFMGVAMSITAFPVLARILTERRLLKSKVGTLAITCAAVDDVTAWCLLAFVVSFVRATGVAQAVRTTLFALAYILAMIFVARPFLRRLGARADNEEGLTQNRVAATLVVLLISSFLTELIGIHALFGAFLLGTVMPKDGGFARALADRLEDLVVVFLLPLFFAYSGLRTQIGLLNTAEAWLMCALVVLVACVGKFGGSAIAARMTGLSWREAGALGTLMNTRGLIELIVLNIGLDLGVISPRLFTMLVIMALLTTFATTPVLELIYPASEIAKEIVEPEPAPTMATPRFTILMCVAYDRSGPGMVTLAHAFAGGAPDTSRLYALRLIPPAERASHYVAASVEQHAVQALAPLLERAAELSAPVRTVAFVSARPAEDICRVAEIKAANLVLLGWHRPLLSRTVLGGTVQDVLKNAPGTVGVFVDRGLKKVAKVLVPYQGTNDDRTALALARRLTETARVQITLLHVVTPGRAGGDAHDLMNETFAEGPDRRASVTMKLVNHPDPAAAAVQEAARGYDLVLVGAGTQWGLEQRMFGLMPESIVRECPTSLVIVHARMAEAARPAMRAARDPYPTIQPEEPPVAAR